MNDWSGPNVELKSKYLSGNVVRKLDIARTEVDPKYRANVEALEKVQPAPLHIEDIDFMLGSFWIPANIIQAWLETAFNTECTVSYGDKGDRWFVNAEYRFRYTFMWGNSCILKSPRDICGIPMG